MSSGRVVGYVLKSTIWPLNYFCMDGLWGPTPKKARVFATAEEAYKQQGCGSSKVLRRVVRHKPGTVGYRVKSFAVLYLNRNGFLGTRPWFEWTKGTLFLTKADAKEALESHPNRPVNGTIVRISLKPKPAGAEK